MHFTLSLSGRYRVTTGRENTRGHHLKIFKQRRNTVQRRKIFSHRVVDTWNDLPREVIEATTINGFKGRLDKYIERVRTKGAITRTILCTKSPSIGTHRMLSYESESAHRL